MTVFSDWAFIYSQSLWLACQYIVGLVKAKKKRIKNKVVPLLCRSILDYINDRYRWFCLDETRLLVLFSVHIRTK